MSDDIVTRLRDSYGTAHKAVWEAAGEIELLRAALALAVGELSTHGLLANTHPEQLMQQFLEEARRG